MTLQLNEMMKNKQEKDQRHICDDRSFIHARDKKSHMFKVYQQR